MLHRAAGTARLCRTASAAAFHPYCTQVLSLHRPQHSSSTTRRQRSLAAAAAAAATAAAVQPGSSTSAPLSFADRPGVWSSEQKLQLKNLTFQELEEWCESVGAFGRQREARQARNACPHVC
jgi:hypothetical protein